MYPDLFNNGLKISCLRNVRNFITLRAFNFVITVYELFENPSMHILIYYGMYNIREGYA